MYFSSLKLQPSNLYKNYKGIIIETAARQNNGYPPKDSVKSHPQAIKQDPASPTIFSTLLPELQKAVSEKGYTKPTPIQEQAIKPLLEGRDILASAQTGTGKTAAFVLPILHYLAQNKKFVIAGQPRVLILAPTRELASQIGDSVSAYGKHLHITRTVIFGGIKQPRQIESLKRGKDILVATPGRLIDLMSQGYINLDAVEIFVLDEADRMLDMGFIPDIRKILSKIPAKRQSMFFSATLSPDIMDLARAMVKNPVEIAVSPEIPTAEGIAQSVCFVDRLNKIHLLKYLLERKHLNKVLVFTNMKHVAGRLAQKLTVSGIASEAIHGDKSQNARIRALENFKKGTVRVLVASDVAARGIDVDKISHVINFDLPPDPETYLHRIGRTARAGSKGDAISFCSAEERNSLREIELFIKKTITVNSDHVFHSVAAELATGKDAKPKPRRNELQLEQKRSRDRLKNPIEYSNGKKPKPASNRFTGRGSR